MMGSLNVTINREDLKKFDEKAKENYSDRAKVFRQFFVDFVKNDELFEELEKIEIAQKEVNTLRISISAKKEDVKAFKIKMIEKDTSALFQVRKFVKYYIQK